MMRPEEYTQEDLRIMNICERCWSALTEENSVRLENNEPPMTEFQRIVMYQRYQDMVVLKYPSERWEEIADRFDALYAEVVESHQYDSYAVC